MFLYWIEKIDYDLAHWLRWIIASGCLSLIKWSNPHKDESLSCLFRDLSLDYERRPGERCRE